MITNLIELAKKEQIDLEVLNSKENVVSIETLNDQLMKYNIEKINGYKLKALYNNKSIVLRYENLDNPKEIINVIKKHASIIDNDNENRLCSNDYNSEERKVKNIDFNEIKENLISFNKLRDKYNFLTNINSIVECYNIEKSIDNSEHHLDDNYDYIELGINISGKKNNVVKSQFMYMYLKDFDKDNILNEIEKNIVILENKFNAKSIKTDKYKILINNIVVNNILREMTDLFNAKNIFLNLSPFSNKLNKKIFSDKITILEEPVNPKFIVNKHFDLEGTLTYDKEIVKNGKFIKAFNDIGYAIKTKTNPTGNASSVICNYHIKEGNKSYDDLVKLLDNGIIITEVQGLHAGINHSTGDISLQAEGLLVEHGKIKSPLNMIILSTNIVEMLSNVIEVGNDLKEFGTSSSSVSLLLDNITISGNEE